MQSFTVHAGSRTRVTSMGGLYDAATLHALLVFAKLRNVKQMHSSLISTYMKQACYISNSKGKAQGTPSTSYGKAKPLRFEGVGPESGEPPTEARKSKKTPPKKTRRPKSDWFNLWASLAAASCSAGKAAPPSKRQPSQREVQGAVGS